MGAVGDVREAEADRTAHRIERRLASTKGEEAGAAEPASPRGQLLRPPTIPDARFPDPGQALAPELRRRLEPTLGVDMSRVRLHTSADAGTLARSLDARAFTLGNHIVLAEQVPLDSRSGQRLLAHELGHLGHQSQTGPIVQRSPYSVSWPEPKPERACIPGSGNAIDTVTCAKQLPPPDAARYLEVLRCAANARPQQQELQDLLARVSAVVPRVEGPQPTSSLGRSLCELVTGLSDAQLRDPALALALLDLPLDEPRAAASAKPTASPGFELPSFDKLEFGKRGYSASFEPSDLKASLSTILPKTMYGEKLAVWASGPKGEVKLAAGLDGAVHLIDRKRADHILSFGVSGSFGQGLGVGLPTSSDSIDGEAARLQMLGHPIPAPKRPLFDSASFEASLAGLHYLGARSKLGWKVIGGYPRIGLNLEFTLTGRKGAASTTHTFDSDRVDAEKARREAVDKAPAALDGAARALATDFVSGVSAVGKLAKPIGAAAKAHSELGKQRSHPQLSVAFDIQYKFESLGSKPPAEGPQPNSVPPPVFDPSLPDKLTGREDPRGRLPYTQPVSELLGEGEGLRVMLFLRVHFDP